MYEAAKRSGSLGLWPSLLPLYVSGFLDTMNMDQRQLDGLTSKRTKNSRAVQRILDNIARISRFVKITPELREMLANHELRVAAMHYHIRHAIVDRTALRRTPPLQSGDLAAWHDLHDSLGGRGWSRCADKRDDPCSCEFVFCAARSPTLDADVVPEAEDDDDDAADEAANMAREALRRNNSAAAWEKNGLELRIVAITFSEEPDLHGPLPSSIANMTALRALSIGNAGGSIENSCEREMASRVLGQTRLRVLHMDWHLHGLQAWKEAGVGKLPLQRWLRGLQIELGGVSATSDSLAEWSFGRFKAQEATASLIDREMKAMRKAKSGTNKGWWWSRGSTRREDGEDARGDGGEHADGGAGHDWLSNGEDDDEDGYGEEDADMEAWAAAESEDGDERDDEYDLEADEHGIGQFDAGPAVQKDLEQMQAEEAAGEDEDEDEREEKEEEEHEHEHEGDGDRGEDKRREMHRRELAARAPRFHGSPVDSGLHPPTLGDEDGVLPFLSLTTLVRELGGERLREAALALGSDDADLLLSVLGFSPKTQSRSWQRARATLAEEFPNLAVSVLNGVVEIPQVRMGWEPSAKEKAWAMRHIESGSEEGEPSIKLTEGQRNALLEEAGSLLECAGIVAVSAIDTAKQPWSSYASGSSYRSGLDGAAWVVMGALSQQDKAVSAWKQLVLGKGGGEEEPEAWWFENSWRWAPGSMVTPPTPVLVRVTLHLARKAGLSEGQARAAAMVAVEGLSLAKAQDEVGAAVHYLCGPQAMAAADVAGAKADAAALAAAAAGASGDGGPPAGVPRPDLAAVRSRVARMQAESMARDELALYQRRVPGGTPPSSLRWLCSLSQLRWLSMAGAVTGLPWCLGEELHHLVDLDVRGCRLGSDPLVAKPLPDSLRLLNRTLRSFIGFQQSTRLCPPQGSRWPINGEAISLRLARDDNDEEEEEARGRMRRPVVVDGDDTPQRTHWRLTGGTGASQASLSAGESAGGIPVPEEALRDAGAFTTWAPGYRAERLRCRPLFEALSDFRGEAAWQCVAVADAHSSQAEQQDRRAAISEGWAFDFADTSEATGAPWWAWHRLEKFWIDGNFAFGQIPENIGALWPKMRTLDLYSNSISGNLPRSMGDMKQLHQLQLQHNRLSGRLPDGLLHPDTLEELVVVHLELNTNLTGCLDVSAWGTPSSTMLTDFLVGSGVQAGGC